MDVYAGSSNVERARLAIGKSRFEDLSPDRWVTPGLSVVILNLDKPEFICPLLAQLARAGDVFGAYSVALRVCVGDTGSNSPEVLAAYAGHAGLRLKSGLHYHFSSNNNEVFIASVDTTHVLFLNNDVSLPGPDSLWKLWRELERTPSLCGAFLAFPNRTIQHAGVSFAPSTSEVIPFHFAGGESWSSIQRTAKDIDAVTGAFLAMPSALFADLGGFDESYVAECQDIDLCLKARRLGVRVRVLDLGNIVHVENGSRPKGHLNSHDRRLLNRRWAAYCGKSRWT